LEWSDPMTSSRVTWTHGQRAMCHLDSGVSSRRPYRPVNMWHLSPPKGATCPLYLTMCHHCKLIVWSMWKEIFYSEDSKLHRNLTKSPQSVKNPEVANSGVNINSWQVGDDGTRSFSLETWHSRVFEVWCIFKLWGHELTRAIDLKEPRDHSWPLDLPHGQIGFVLAQG